MPAYKTKTRVINRAIFPRMCSHLRLITSPDRDKVPAPSHTSTRCIAFDEDFLVFWFFFLKQFRSFSQHRASDQTDRSSDLKHLVRYPTHGADSDQTSARPVARLG